jgi:predicted O-methyltransferase YrrM
LPTSPNTLWSILADNTTYPEIEAILPQDVSSPVISPQLGRLLARLVIQRKLLSILEFGAGTSSIVLATALSCVGGGKLTSVEHQPQYSTESWRSVNSMKGIDAQLIVSPLRRRMTSEGLYWWYVAASGALNARAPFDLVLIDAPPKSFGRDAPLFQALPHLRAGSVIVLDDARRRRESRIVRRWQRSLPGIELLIHDRTFGNRGIALLAFGENISVRPSGVNVIESIHEQWLRWRRGSRLPTDPDTEE